MCRRIRETRAELKIPQQGKQGGQPKNRQEPTEQYRVLRKGNSFKCPQCRHVKFWFWKSVRVWIKISEASNFTLNKEGNISNFSVRHAKNSHFCCKKSMSFTENQWDLTGLPVWGHRSIQLTLSFPHLWSRLLSLIKNNPCILYSPMALKELRMIQVYEQFLLFQLCFWKSYTADT